MPFAVRNERLVDYVFVVGAPFGSEEAIVLERLPVYERQDAPWPQSVPLFCFPQGVEFIAGDAKEAVERMQEKLTEAEFFVFTLTDSQGRHHFGSCLKFFERRPLHETGVRAKRYSAKVMCILSHWPFFEFFEKYMRAVHGAIASKSVRTSTISSCICDLVARIPLPPPGTLLKYRFPHKMETNFISFLRAPETALPEVDDYCIRKLFEYLSPKNILTILSCMLMEQRVLLHSTQLGALGACSEALCSLLYPLYWPHVYIPVLPASLLTYLESPMPFLVGVHTSSLETVECLNVLPSSLIVHVDANRIIRPMEVELPGAARRTSVNRILTSMDALPEFPRSLKKSVLKRWRCAFAIALEKSKSKGIKRLIKQSSSALSTSSSMSGGGFSSTGEVSPLRRRRKRLR